MIGRSCGVAVWLGLFCSQAIAQQEIKLTVASGHPAVTGSVALIRDVFIPEVDKRLAAGGKYKIVWTQSYAGAIAKPPAMLKAIEDGAADVGHVPFLFNADRLPLEQVTYVTPFGPEDPVKLARVINQLRERVPEMNQQIYRHKQVILASLTTDAYQIVAKKPLPGIADFKGVKLGTAGQAANWVRNTGAVTVAGNLTTFYNSMQTGVFDGVITFDTAIAAYKFHEVAPYINQVGFGAMYASGLTVNERRWKSFPDEVRQAFLEVAPIYETKSAEYYRDAGEKSIRDALAQGAKLVPVAAAERARLAAMLPNIALEWAKAAEAKGLPGLRTLKTYMELSRAAGVAHARAWDQE